MRGVQRSEALYFTATVKPIEEIAEFLVGMGAECEVVDLGHQRDLAGLRVGQPDAGHQADDGADIGNERDQPGDQPDHQPDHRSYQQTPPVTFFLLLCKIAQNKARTVESNVRWDLKSQR